MPTRFPLFSCSGGTSKKGSAQRSNHVPVKPARDHSCPQQIHKTLDGLDAVQTLLAPQQVFLDLGEFLRLVDVSQVIPLQAVNGNMASGHCGRNTTWRKPLANVLRDYSVPREFVFSPYGFHVAFPCYSEFTP